MKGLKEWMGFNSRGFGCEEVRKQHFQLQNARVFLTYRVCVQRH